MGLDVGEKIKNLRINKGLTEDELADRLGISTSNPSSLFLAIQLSMKNLTLASQGEWTPKQRQS